jgi:hypothetical protein
MKTLIVTVSIQINKNDFSYLEKGKKLIISNLEFTDFDILLLTNNVEYFNEIKNNRLMIIDYDKTFNEPIISGQKFNMHIKRLAIRLGSQRNYDVVFHNDCDCYITGWDNESYLNLINGNYDVIFPTNPRPQLGGLRKSYKHFQDKIDKEFVNLYYEELDYSPNPTETRIIFKNNDKLKLFLNFWDKISNNNKNYLTYYCGVYFGTSSKHANMEMGHVTVNDKFSEFCKISHQNKVLNYFGYPTNE